MNTDPEIQRSFLRRHAALLSTALAVAAGAWMRLWMLAAFPQVTGDTLTYGSIAKNLLAHSQYALTDGSGVTHSTLIRLPGYPLFLAMCFRLFGMENYTAVSYVQIALELIGCLLLAEFVRRIATPAAGQCTLWLAMLCPFTAVYAGAPMTEAPTLFAIGLALWSLGRFEARPGWPSALGFTFGVTFAALLRPDGALVGVALAPALGMAIWPGIRSSSRARARLLPMALVCLLLALAPFAVWTARNERVFHVFEPLAPRYATDPGEEIYPGFQSWMKTWCLDFVSTFDIYWNVPDDPIDVSKLPARAFDTAEQQARTAELFKEYNSGAPTLTPEIDEGFGQLAAERIQTHPLRSYLWLPLGRMADMWLRPRVEDLNIDLDWWVYSHHHVETEFSWGWAGLNAAYLLLGAVGLWLRPRYWAWMLLYFVLRSALLMTIEAPEARYTLECFPMLFALGGIALARCAPVRWMPRSGRPAE
jgi:hypothetical protein